MTPGSGSRIRLCGARRWKTPFHIPATHHAVPPSPSTKIRADERYSPNFGYEVLDGVPSQRSIRNFPPPPCEVGLVDVRVHVEVVCDGNLWVFKWTANEPDVEMGQVLHE